MRKHIFAACLMLLSLCGYAQTQTVKGVVTSAVDNEPLIGAVVQVKGTTNGAVTDLDGQYTLNNVNGDGVLVVSLIGYETLEISVGNRAVINCALNEENLELDEVVVIGYGVAKKSDITSSISSVKGEEITESIKGNAMDALQGKINGVQIVSGGGPGTQPSVIIRGVTTVNGSAPLYVVDGMPVGTDINFINNNDIESMEVLKDASAAAIYGTRGSNGVILITTKKGSASEGKAHVTFSASAGFQTLKKPNMAKASEYEQVMKARYINDGRDPVWNSGDNLTDADGTDWWDEVINKTALVQNYSLNVSGGTQKFVYNLSVGYYRNDSQYDYGYWDKINIRLNTEYTFNKYVKIGMDMAPRVESWDNTPDLFSAAMAMDPTTPVFRPESEWDDNVYNNYARSYNNQEWNPAASVARMDSHSQKYGFLMNPYIQITPVEGLTIRSQFGVNAYIQRSSSYTPEFEIDALEHSTYSTASRSYDEYLDWDWTTTVNYTKTFNKKHNLNAMVGFTAERFSDHTLSGSRDDIPSNMETMREVHAGTLNQQADGNTSYQTLVSYLARVMYNYDARYYITATVRADGSSNFPVGQKYAVFPSVSVAWRISNEAFMKHQHVVSDMKLRLGWGQVGNQNISSTSTLTLLDSADAVFGTDQSRLAGTAVSTVGNATLRWETVEDMNLGLDMSFFKNRLGVIFDLYQKTSKNMLYAKQNILALGYPNWDSEITMNVGSMRASGWELGLSWRDNVGSDWSYDIGLNLSGVRNKAIKLSGDGAITTGSLSSDSIIRNEDGGLIGRFYGYVADGLFQNWEEVYAHTDEHGTLLQANAQPGDIRFLDLNNDGVINEEDKTYIGNAYPDLMIGLNLSLSWRNIDFTANFYGTVGNDIFNLNKQLYAGISGSNVYAGTYAKAWNGEGTSNDIPRLSVNDLNQNYTRVSSFFVEDGSYFRCKSLQIGYTFPQKWMGKTSLRLSFTAQNPFTITGYSGMDPERAQLGASVLETGIDTTAYPNPRTFLFGVDFKF